MPKTTKPNLSALAREFKVTRRTIGVWRDKEGIDLSDHAAVALRAQLMKSNAGQGLDLAQARLAKLTVETDRIRHALAVDRGEFVSAANVRSEAHFVGVQFREAIDRAVNDLPPMLGGRKSVEIHRILRDYFHKVLTDLGNRKSAPPNWKKTG